MSEITDSIGAVTGIIGALTGITGMVTGCLAYLKSNKIKKLDLRLELRKQLASAHHELAAARSGIDLGNRSRLAVMSATGLLRSGANIIWSREVEADTAALDRIAASIRGEGTDFTEFGEKQLESEIVALHKLVTQISAISTKYRDALADDDARRREIRQEVANRTNSMLGSIRDT